MPKHTAPLPLQLPSEDGPQLRYHPLSGFGCADYVEEHVGLLETSGAFDALKYSTAELHLSNDKLDLAGLASLGSAFATLLVKSAKEAKTLRSLITDHCKRFKVQAYDDARATWYDLDTPELIDATLDFATMLEVVYALAGGVLRPLWNRLRSSGEAKLGESPKPSPNATPAS